MVYTQKGKIHLYAFILMLLNGLLLLYAVQHISLSIYELNYIQNNFIGNFFFYKSIAILGNNPLAHRLPFIIIHLCNLVLFYHLSCQMLKKHIDSLWALVLFMLLPATQLAGILVSQSGIIMLLLLLIIYSETQQKQWLLYPLLFLVLWIDFSFMILYISFCFYSFFQKKYFLMFVSLLLLIARINLGTDVFGVPKGFFLDTLAIFGMLFSPLLFVYYTYVLYRIFVKEDKKILWYICAVSLICSLLLSMRQKIPLQSFVPFFSLGIILCVQVFMSGLRVRLKPFRKTYMIYFKITFATLLVFFFALVCNKIFYVFLNDPRDHFAYKFHIAHELSSALKQRGITSLNTDTTLQKRLAFYGISTGEEYTLSTTPQPQAEVIKIYYIGTLVGEYYLY